MNIFSVLMLFGGLSMFLYGMRLMGDGLKESSSGTLKRIMEHVTNNPVKAFLLGLVVTADDDKALVVGAVEHIIGCGLVEASIHLHTWSTSWLTLDGLSLSLQEILGYLPCDTLADGVG